MKKLISKIVLATIISVFTLTSCLGDSDNFQELTDFCYVTKSSSGVVYAASSNGFITSPEIQLLDDGTCYYIRYKISGNSTVSGGITTVEVKEKPKEVDTERLSYTVPRPIAGIDEITKNTISIGFSGVNGDYYGNNFLISYRFALEKGDGVYPEFYYDVNNQIDSDGKTQLGAAATVESENRNKVIIDIRFNRFNNPGGVKDDTVKEVAVSFDGLKNTFRSQVAPLLGTKDVFFGIKFRYVKTIDETTGAIKEYSYLGAWVQGQNSYPTYYLYYPKAGSNS